MRAYSLSHLSDTTLLRDLAVLVARDRTTTAELLAHLAEVDERKLYLPAGYTSMHAYCVGALHLSEDAAYKRIQVARAARQFPALFIALADGRIHLTGLGLLAPHLTRENVAELLVAAEHRRKSEIESLIAQRFPGPDVPPGFRTIRALPCAQLAPAQVGPDMPKFLGSADAAPSDQGTHGMLGELAPAQVASPRPEAATPRYLVQLTIEQATHDKLRYAQALLGHAVPSGDVAQVLDRALDALIARLEKSKFAATSKPRATQHSTAISRHIPAHVRRAVWERDQGQCTFVGTTGHRCAARKFLEFDHVEAVARGGQATVAGMRLRCRAHNQYEAERLFGAEFMQAKRDAARRAATEAQARRSAREVAETRARGAAREAAEARARREQERDVVPWLRQLGFRADEARRAAAHCVSIPDAPLEDRVRLALSRIPVRGSYRVTSAPQASG